MKPAEKDSHRIIRRITVKGKLSGVIRELNKLDAFTESAPAVLSSRPGVKDILAFFRDEKHFSQTLAALKKNKSFKILAVEDEILRIHRGGKLAVRATVKLDTVDDLRKVYTPGVAQVCKYIQDNPSAAREYTAIGNTVCIATNGSAVLGLGDIGVLAGMPVMEGKSVILNKMAEVNCIPILIDSGDAAKIVSVLEAISPTFGLIMIEDIAAPLCFDVENQLQERLSIPVFHDDQHGTATVILAALLRALVGAGPCADPLQRKKEDVKIVINGAGAAAIATTKMLLEYGFKHIVLCDREGIIFQGRSAGMNHYKEEIAQITNKSNERGDLAFALKDKDVFIGLSGPGLVTPQMLKRMNKSPIVFALANPVPEIWPAEALSAGASIALDGKTINNALIFPGLIKGTLQARAKRINYAMKFAAAEKLAALCNKNEVVPDFMDLKVHAEVAKAVCAALK
jgi:malate dehydrogenase (oxaloacetate-decarboxylating)